MFFGWGLRDGPPIVEARTGFPILDSRLKTSGMTEGGGGNDRGETGGHDRRDAPAGMTEGTHRRA